MDNQALAERHLVGSHLGHYLLQENIGAGGAGEVYRARDEHLSRDVAIKVLSLDTLADAQGRHDFRREALTLSKLNHPSIAIVYDFDSDQGVDFLVTEYVPGISLTERLTKGPLPEEDIIQLATQLVEGITAAHGQGIVHRDLLPGNL